MNISKSCFSFVKTAKELSTEFNFNLTSSDIGVICDVYPDTQDDFSEVLSYLGNISGLNFIMVDTISNNENGFFIAYHDSEWSIHNCPNKKKQQLYLCVSSKKPEKLSIYNIIRFWGQNKSRIAALTLTSFVLSLTALAIPLYMNAVYGKIIPAFAESSLWALSFFLISLFLLDIYLKHKKNILFSSLIRSFSSCMEPNYLRAIIAVTSSGKNRWGADRSEAIAHLTQIKNILWALLSSNAIDVFFCSIYFIVMGIISGWLVVVPLCISIILVLGILFFTFNIEPAKPNIQNDMLFKDSYIEQQLAEGQATKFISTYVNQTLNANKKTEDDLLKKNAINSFIAFLSSFQTVSIIIVAFYLVRDFNLPVGAIFATIILSGKVIQALSPLPNIIGIIQGIRQISTQINNFLLSSEKNDDNDISLKVKDSQWVIQDCSISFNKENKLIDNISLSIKEGEKVAIVGPSGNGKSVLIRLLLGVLKPDSGYVSWDEPGGFKTLWSKCFYADQREYTSLSLHDYYDGNIDNMKKALSYSFMKWAPDIFNNGPYAPPSIAFRNLTPAQKQLLDLSRLFVCNRKVIVMDEPLTATAAGTEKLLIDFINHNLNNEHTLILGTNKKELINTVDRVIYVNNGRIIFDGKKDVFLSSVL